MYICISKSTTAEHSTGSGHQIMFQETDILAKTSSYRDQLAKDEREKDYICIISTEKLPKNGTPAPDQ
jgi:hypothetical protein